LLVSIAYGQWAYEPFECFLGVRDALSGEDDELISDELGAGLLQKSLDLVVCAKREVEKEIRSLMMDGLSQTEMPVFFYDTALALKGASFGR